MIAPQHADALGSARRVEHPAGHSRAFFLFFMVSGFCGLLDEVVWTRLAMAHFGATTAVVSVVLSVFMAGLALGSWIAGSPLLLTRIRSGRGLVRAYALVELGIGTGALAVPWLFDRARTLLLGLGAANSARYHLASALLMIAAMLPWATLMGSTYALAMSALGATVSSDDRRVFSLLYLANVLGAALGVLTSALVLIELLGFRTTLVSAAALNALVAALAWRHSTHMGFTVAPARPASRRVALSFAEPALLVVLFASGFVSMALELVWTRLFSRYLGTFVYSFASVLAVYLSATFLGSRKYRRSADLGLPLHAERWWALLGLCAILPLGTADPRLWLGHDGFWAAPIALLGIVPFCASLGYLTPLLVDRYGGGDPGRASRAYAVNVLGCIPGPLCAGYVLLPYFGERGAITLIAVIPLVIGWWATLQERRVRPLFVANVALTLAISASFRSYAASIPNAIVSHDHVATVVAYTDQSGHKMLLVNGVGITHQTTITKMMAHLPAAHLARPPVSALVICFGMGTTFRSLLSWNVPTTAIDLVPSVPALFDYFVPGGSAVLKPGVAEIVIDDGRRYLERTRGPVDVVTIDPPPPVEAAGSSLLYSREFYRVVKTRLAPDGIVQQWLPTSDPALAASVVRALTDEFSDVRVFESFEGWGLHFLASNRPIRRLAVPDLVVRMPAAAIADLTEWLPEETAETLFGRTLSREMTPRALIARSPDTPTLTDDRPVNEYFLLRETRARLDSAGGRVTPGR
jgi:spermidine synthase